MICTLFCVIFRCTGVQIIGTAKNFEFKDNFNPFYVYENRDMAIAMSSSRAEPVLGLNISSSCPGWGYLNI